MHVFVRSKGFHSFFWQEYNFPLFPTNAEMKKTMFVLDVSFNLLECLTMALSLHIGTPMLTVLSYALWMFLIYQALSQKRTRQLECTRENKKNNKRLALSFHPGLGLASPLRAMCGPLDKLAFHK